MDPKHLKKSRKNKSGNSYVEIYIEENGRLIFTPLTNNTAPIFKTISIHSEDPINKYCG